MDILRGQCCRRQEEGQLARIAASNENSEDQRKVWVQGIVSLRSGWEL